MTSIPVKRVGSVVRVAPGRLADYKACHERVWPGILDTIRACNIKNYSIYHKDGYLFSYFEYMGADYEADMAKMAADPLTKEWWAFVKPMQAPLPTRGAGEWWATMEEVFHLD